MELDLNKFRTLIPINSLYEDNLAQLAKQARVERYLEGETVFRKGDTDEDTLFLMSGALEQLDAQGNWTRIAAGDTEADYALANSRPRACTARVVSASAVIARVNSQLLEKHLTWGQVAVDGLEGLTVEEYDAGALADGEWMMSMLRTPAFLRLPAANIQTLFQRMEEIPVAKGTVVIRQGGPGDFFYLVKQGRCRVTERSSAEERVLAELGPNDSFGEEALISNAPRNATVTMRSDGKLMRLAKSDFLALLEEPLLKYVSLEDLGDAITLDVRLESEFRHSAIKGSRNLPLYLLRAKAALLDPAQRYILCCDTGARSSAAAFILGNLGFDVYVLKGGLSAGRS